MSTRPLSSTTCSWLLLIGATMVWRGELCCLQGRVPPGLPPHGNDWLPSLLALGSAPEMLLDKEADALDSARGLRDQGRGHLPHMPHALPDL